MKLKRVRILGIGLLLAAIVTTSIMHWFNKQTTGTIVILNGTSSAGKSSIIKVLHPTYQNSCIFVSLDDFIKTYMIKCSFQEIEWDLLFNAFYKHAKQLSKNNTTMFIDTVQFDAHYDHYSSILGQQTIKILVYCPLDAVIDHVEKRNNSSDKDEKRTINQAFDQFQNIYKRQDSPNETVVDRIQTSSMKHALQIAEQEVQQLMKEAGKSPEEIKKNIQSFVKPFVEQFKLDTLDEITLTTIHPWDLIINSSINSPEESAQIITDYLKQNKDS